MTSSTSLRITEIFYSLQGESDSIGWPTTFVRLTGCPLRCSYCDTAYAFHGGQSQSIASIIEQVTAYPARHITITGGEPLAQKNVHLLMEKLCDLDYIVSLETSGALKIQNVDPRVRRVVDVKTPSSLEVKKNLSENYQHLRQNDQIKYVIGNRSDYDWAKAHLNQHQLLEQCMCFFSPCNPELSVTDLANWIIEDRLQVRLQVQLHKIIWGDCPGK